MRSNGILIFDLYPLPLPTFIYDSVKFVFADPQKEEYEILMNEHFSPLMDKLGSQENKPKVFLRYEKLKDRTEFGLFKDYFVEKVLIGSDFLNISKNLNPDTEEILSIFKEQLEAFKHRKK